MFADSDAHANMGISTVSQPGFMLFWLFIPIVAIELFVLKRILGTTFRRTALVVIVGNAVTTAIGFALDLHRFTRHIFSISEWVQFWRSPIVNFGILLLFFLLSWLIEYLLARPIMSHIEACALRRAVFRANLITYILLAVILLFETIVLW